MLTHWDFHRTHWQYGTLNQSYDYPSIRFAPSAIDRSPPRSFHVCNNYMMNQEMQYNLSVSQNNSSSNIFHNNTIPAVSPGPYQARKPQQKISFQMKEKETAADVETMDAAMALISLPVQGVPQESLRECRKTSLVLDSDYNDPLCIERSNGNIPAVVSPTFVTPTPLSNHYVSISLNASSDCGSSLVSETSLDTPRRHINEVRNEVPVLKSEQVQSITSSSVKRKWFIGSVSLAMPEDEDVLSPLHCFMRKYCIEAFTAPDSQPQYSRSHGSKITSGTVGIRCIHCKDRPINERAERAVCYPSSVKNIYYSMETWQRRHAALCTDIPGWIKRQMTNLIKSSRSCAGGRRQYWSDAAIKMGMVDTPQGIRFGSPPGLYEVEDKQSAQEKISQRLPFDGEAAKVSLVSSEDKFLITEYLYLLMEQMEPCRFSEHDRSGGRSKIKDNNVGYPGMQCKHCSGKAGFGRYFPTSVYSLTLANSDRNIYNHMMKCRRCPSDIKEKLQEQHYLRVGDGAKNKRGSRKIFFTRVWEKLHGTESCQNGNKDPSPLS